MHRSTDRQTDRSYCSVLQCAQLCCTCAFKSCVGVNRLSWLSRKICQKFKREILHQKSHVRKWKRCTKYEQKTQFTSRELCITAFEECDDQMRHTCDYVHICLHVFDCIHVYMCNHMYIIFVWYIYICTFTYIKHTHTQYIAMFIHTQTRAHGIYVVGAGMNVFYPAARTTHWRYSAQSLRRAIYIRTHTHTHTNTITLSLSHTAYAEYTHTHTHTYTQYFWGANLPRRQLIGNIQRKVSVQLRDHTHTFHLIIFQRRAHDSSFTMNLVIFHDTSSAISHFSSSFSMMHSTASSLMRNSTSMFKTNVAIFHDVFEAFSHFIWSIFVMHLIASSLQIFFLHESASTIEQSAKRAVSSFWIIHLAASIFHYAFRSKLVPEKFSLRLRASRIGNSQEWALYWFLVTTAVASRLSRNFTSADGPLLSEILKSEMYVPFQ